MSQTIEVYTDGSHFKHAKNTMNSLGYGAYLNYESQQFFIAGKINPMILHKYDIPHMLISNPTAEFIGFAEALTNLPKTKKTIIFYSDYIGIKHWMEGTWKAKEIYIKNIRDYCNKYIKYNQLNVIFQHIPGHSGIYGNEVADSLAKQDQPINTFPQLLHLL